MSDQDLRERERRFLAAPDPASALELARVATRQTATTPARTAFGWLLDLGTWDALDSQARRATAQLLQAWTEARGLTLVNLRDCQQQGLNHEIAFFRDREQREFSLVPGGRVEIGYDPQTFDPTNLNTKMQEWAESERDTWAVDGPEAVEEAVQLVEEMRVAAIDGVRALNRRRTVDVPPMFVEATPEGMWGRQQPHAVVSELVSAEGYRLLRSDEWEYCCAAGTKTLFRWGDEFPDGEMDPDAEAPNAYGLRFHASPAGTEYCLEPDKVRNGDGGVGLCGGEGPVAFLPLSAWYEGPARFDAGLIRRVLDLDQCLCETIAPALPRPSKS